MKLGLGKIIVGIGALSALLPVMVMVAQTFMTRRGIIRMADIEVVKMAEFNTSQIAKDVYGMCHLSWTSFSARNEQCRRIGMGTLRDLGEVSLGDGKDGVVKWRAVNQNDENAVIELELPSFTFGGQPVRFNDDPGVRSDIVDDIGDATGVECSIFQRMNPAGDMLRVASTVTSKNGKRFIGTYIPAIDPDGQPNECVKRLLDGRHHGGLMDAGEHLFISNYEPLFDNQGKLIGAFGIGVKIDATDYLIDFIREMKVGDRGFVWCGIDRGGDGFTVKCHRGDGIEGESLAGCDQETKRFFAEIAESARELKPGEVGFKEGDWRAADDAKAGKKYVAYTYFKPWNWVIAAVAYDSDFDQMRDAVFKKTGHMAKFLVLGGIALLIIVIIGGGMAAARIAKPLRGVVKVANHIAEGDVAGAKEAIAGVETNKKLIRTIEVENILNALRSMTGNLTVLLGSVVRSGVEMGSSVTELAASARQLEAGASEQASSIHAVRDNSHDISRTSDDLDKAAREVAKVVDDAAAMAATGHDNLDKMRATMEQLVDATSSIAGKLAVINDTTGKISSVVTTINRIMDQTNLLSLNAAIEAEKAGDQGQGFSVIAREISRLADMTAKATREIEDMVAEMRSSVSSGVMEMDRFKTSVEHGGEEITGISSQLEKIIAAVGAIGPRFEELSHGTGKQSASAVRISETMGELAAAADQSRDSLAEFNSALNRLRDTAEALRAEVAKFKIDGGKHS